MNRKSFLLSMTGAALGLSLAAAVPAFGQGNAALPMTVKTTQGHVLIVGHSNTVPDLIRKLGVTDAVTIGDDDYDNLFVVVRSTGGKATLVRLKY